jgi:hypothetical protein
VQYPIQFNNAQPNVQIDKLNNNYMNIKELKTKFYIFGNKGNVWSNSAHIAESGATTTLCGTPMLSRNWAFIENFEEIGCQECLKRYKLASMGIEYPCMN